MLIAQLTDCHIGEPGKGADQRYGTGERLSRCVAAVLDLTRRPDVVLVTGDLVDSGKPEEYRHLRALLGPLDVPYYLIPGNHDDRGALRSVFDDHSYLPASGFLHYALDREAPDNWPVRLVGLDTLVPGQDAGALDDERLAWLDGVLAAQPERPTFVFMHHPPFRTGNRAIDALGLAGAADFEAVLRRHRQVVHVAAGHVHRPIASAFAARLCTTSPATAYPMFLDVSDDPALRLEPAPPAFQLHLWLPEGGYFVTHTSTVAA
jgi:3',5'-cyclic AMP phosphodiesterase CpdA